VRPPSEWHARPHVGKAHKVTAGLENERSIPEPVHPRPRHRPAQRHDVGDTASAACRPQNGTQPQNAGPLAGDRSRTYPAGKQPCLPPQTVPAGNSAGIFVDSREILRDKNRLNFRTCRLFCLLYLDRSAGKFLAFPTQLRTASRQAHIAPVRPLVRCVETGNGAPRSPWRNSDPVNEPLSTYGVNANTSRCAEDPADGSTA
jgi:hypothetical protein